MNVRAKFRVVSKEQSESGFKVQLFPVVGNSQENAKFYKYTPAGSIELSTINEVAAAAMEVGREYYVDFIPAEN